MVFFRHRCHEAFVELNDRMVCQIYHQKWYGMNLLVIDGSIAHLLNKNLIVEYLGGWIPNLAARFEIVSSFLMATSVTSALSSRLYFFPCCSPFVFQIRA